MREGENEETRETRETREESEGSRKKKTRKLVRWRAMRLSAQSIPPLDWLQWEVSSLCLGVEGTMLMF